MNEQPMMQSNAWVESAKEHIQGIFDKLGISSAVGTNMAVAFILGFVANFAVSRLGKLFFYVVGLFVIALFALQHYNILTIHVNVIQYWFGQYSITSLQDFVNVVVNLVKDHLFPTIAFVLGYIIAGRII